MTDEPNGQSADDDNRLPEAWTMPKPVFRSSEGVTPKNRLPDEAAFVSTDPDMLSGAETPAEKPDEDTDTATNERGRIKVVPAQPKAKTGGCAFSVVAILLMVAAGLAALIVVLAYFYYSTPPPDPFN